MLSLKSPLLTLLSAAFLLILPSLARADLFSYPVHEGYVVQLGTQKITVTENGVRHYIPPFFINTPKPWTKGMKVSFSLLDQDEPLHVDTAKMKIEFDEKSLKTAKPLPYRAASTAKPAKKKSASLATCPAQQNKPLQNNPKLTAHK